jgi:hypothetical protein
LNLEYNGLTLEMVNTGGKWLEKNNKIPPEKAENIVSFIRYFAFTNYFPNQQESDLQNYGFFLPDITFLVKDENNHEIKFLLARFNNMFYLAYPKPSYYTVYILHTDAPQNLFGFLNSLNL